MSSMSDKKRIFIVDGYGQIYRSYFAFMNNPLRDRDGNNVSAVFGFFNTIMSLVRQHGPEYLVVAMDSRGKTFRHELYPQYKANREKAPEDLHAQVPVINSFLDGMHIPHFERQGMEADDIIATIAKKASAQGIETVMVTGDKDLLQLVRSDVLALRPPRKGEKDYWLCNADGVYELYGVRPDQIVDYLTILGDSSDNVPGVNGIGEKGAVKLLSEYGTLDNVYENIASLPKGTAAKLEAARDHVELSRTLVRLCDSVFDDPDLDFGSFGTSLIDWNEGVKLFRSIGSESLAKAAARLAPSGKPGPQEPEEKAEEAGPEAKTVDIGASDLEGKLSALPDGTVVYIALKTAQEELFSEGIQAVELTWDGETVYRAEPSDDVKAVIVKNLGRMRLAGQDLKSVFKNLRSWGLGKAEL